MHGSEANMLSKLRKYVGSHQPIPIETMVEAFNTASNTRPDIEYRRAASDIMPEAGVYLHPVELSWFVSARGSDGEARESIRHRRAYITRAAALLPALLSLLIVKNNNDLESILRRIDDFCRDFPVIRAAPHEKKVRKEIRSGLRRVSRTVAELAELLDEFGRHIDIEFVRRQNIWR